MIWVLGSAPVDFGVGGGGCLTPVPALLSILGPVLDLIWSPLLSRRHPRFLPSGPQFSDQTAPPFALHRGLPLTQMPPPRRLRFLLEFHIYFVIIGPLVPGSSKS